MRVSPLPVQSRMLSRILTFDAPNPASPVTGNKKGEILSGAGALVGRRQASQAESWELAQGSDVQARKGAKHGRRNLPSQIA